MMIILLDYHNWCNPIIIDDDYSLGKDRVGNVFAKCVGAKSGVKKRTIWVPKPIVTNLLGPNLVGDQQAQTWSIGCVEDIGDLATFEELRDLHGYISSSQVNWIITYLSYTQCSSLR